MIDLIAFNAAVQSGNVLWKIITASKQLIENNELVTAVSEVNAKIISAQAVALNAQQEQAALAQRVRELEQKIMALENWEREKERYDLYAAPLGTFTHRLKANMAQGEPIHYLCANCFTDKKKSVLQFAVGKYSVEKVCPRCKDHSWVPTEDFIRFFPVHSPQ
jgi:hypothetical protein